VSSLGKRSDIFKRKERVTDFWKNSGGEVEESPKIGEKVTWTRLSKLRGRTAIKNYGKRDRNSVRRSEEGRNKKA